MSHSPTWRRYLRVFGPNIEREVNDELAFHLEMRAQDLIRRGLTPEAARTEAADRFGSFERIRAECLLIDKRREQSMARAQILDELKQDTRYGARSLLRRPAFTAAAVLTLALGIGANSAIFSMVNAFLFRPFPSPRADRLVVIGQTSRGINVGVGSISYPNFVDIHAQRAIFEDALAFDAELVSLRASSEAESERRFVEFVTPNVFSLLALRPSLGRPLTVGDAREPVLVLGYRLWRTRFASDPSVVGKAVTLDGIPYTIIGVAPESFHGTANLVDMEAFAPLETLELIQPGSARGLQQRERNFLRVWGLLQPGVTVAQARAAVEVLARRLDAQYPELGVGLSFILAPEARARPDLGVSDAMPRVAAVFMALVALVLLIACVNVTNLMLARGAARRTEMALRRAIGASPLRLVRQLLTESVLLALAGLVVGAALAHWTLGWLSRIHVAIDVPIRFDFAPDWRVFAFAVAVSVIAGAASGLAPAMQQAGARLGDVLREGGRDAGGGVAGRRFRSALVVAQVATSLTLLVCAGLFARSVREAAKVDLGFRPDHLLLASTDVTLQRYDTARAMRFYEQLLERTKALPGVQSAALARNVPLGTENNMVDLFFDEDVPGVEGRHTESFYTVVTPDYFRTMGIPLLQGRELSRFDVDSSSRVAVISTTMAQRYWPGLNPVGRHLRFERDGPPVEVVGVVGDTKQLFLTDAPRPFLYVPLAQSYKPNMTLHVRTTGDPASLAPVVRQLFRGLDHDLPVFDVKTMDTHLRDGVAYFFIRLAALLATVMGVLALVQTLVGLYGVISYGVSQRTREIGIRMALGARGADVVRAVVAQGAVLALSGIAIGLVVSLAASRLIGRLLVGVRATDVVTYAGASLLLAALALASAYLPARRAARLQPVSALRAD